MPYNFTVCHNPQPVTRSSQQAWLAYDYWMYQYLLKTRNERLCNLITPFHWCFCFLKPVYNPSIPVHDFVSRTLLYSLFFCSMLSRKYDHNGSIFTFIFTSNVVKTSCKFEIIRRLQMNLHLLNPSSDSTLAFKRSIATSGITRTRTFFKPLPRSAHIYQALYLNVGLRPAE